MKNITKDEIYSWTPDDPECPNSRARIPDEMHQQLEDALAYYRNVCKIIHEYLTAHPEDDLR